MKKVIIILIVFAWAGVADAGATGRSSISASWSQSEFVGLIIDIKERDKTRQPNTGTRPLQLAQSNNNRNRGGNSGLSFGDAMNAIELGKRVFGSICEPFPHVHSRKRGAPRHLAKRLKHTHGVANKCGMGEAHDHENYRLYFNTRYNQ